ncbi:uncharacterized protein LOC120640914 isoform X1 [Panicum virgatum]|uniref:uncharacterized protein LOC120640914 isoform X1 n=1 Tax=Panicum virgatum TaxID=38727 RepID=UPI0019D4F574|nr:uncharacterized protein LOC120640914 isoform X1 [Panicum virgatum]XP_039772775.1 uncharacterized protein LOC120640914 isoform X1 [Panicum virgatum]XP_039772776.1 uncharacterized protein LOC120640914 isoform X1 [Panicum virgatum]XP_039772777.1 uncharacterized protein LOC120640914 isoform X1 [Panicum virgatum]XP_039772779.1 uncharacterized protein LOC120640914 isoform X1 [Panicum virgatum]XP_039772780.1 uncharacterized protein LOC120640914 isoform X1 [Panicum virgatum]
MAAPTGNAAFLLLLLSACCAATLACDPSGAKFGYVGSVGPDHWGALSPNFTACAVGTNQSPIDIATAAAVCDPALQPLRRDYTVANATLVDNVFNIAVRKHRAAVRRRRRERDRGREAVPAEADALALAVGAHRRRAEVPRGAPHGPRQRRRQRHRRGDALPLRQAGPVPLAAAGQARRALRRGLRRREGRPGARRRREPVAAAAALPHVLPLRGVLHHAALHRERRLEHPRPGAGDVGGPGRRPDGAAGAGLPAQQQADAADERPRRPGLPRRGAVKKIEHKKAP